MTKKKLGTLFAVLSVVLGADLVAASPDFHFALTKSSPEANTTVAPPEEVRLWFSQVPQEGSVSVRLMDAGGDLVETGGAAPDEADRRVWSVAIGHTLSAGAYTVAMARHR